MADTIVAIASPPGQSPRGLVRVSGPRAAAVLASWCEQAPAEARSFGVVRLRPPLPPIPALACLFRGPASFTGEDSAELQVPGHPALLARVVEAARRVPGCRSAQAGEFAFRAWRNGKLSLTQAEGLAATLGAEGEMDLRAARFLRHDLLGQAAVAESQRLGDALALVEAGIDFTDQEDVVPISPQALLPIVATSLGTLGEVRASARRFASRPERPALVLVGAPSAGKSTLFNRLLGRPRAVVDAAPGTTRDVLEEAWELPLGGGRSRPVRLLDVAGVGEATADPLHAEAQAQARAAISGADLVLLLRRADRPAPAWEAPAGVPVVRVATHADLAPAPAGWLALGPDLPLEPLLSEAAAHLSGGHAEGAASLAPRHVEALEAAIAALESARELLAGQQHARALLGTEQVAAGLRTALDRLAPLCGSIPPDEVVGRIFSRFCVGK